MSKTRKRTRARKITPQRDNDQMAKAVGAYLGKNGWDAHVVGPCEVRTGTPGGDLSGRVLAQYEFIAKFYGRRTPPKEETPCKG